ncbi:hypothetical protein [Arthrobacter sp. VKM Ac-2550]|uniref:hypothetical protein n=1 Tax=Crystallibacter permensis TaxID=1938888 RepID=UPI002226ED60|nr:hypothetical protein [Arthrobacter sp. VKM Ac-2550]MCW2134334.1 hypothetical protein [Arthrobacter sp. VKM Ac-2550]
MGYRLAKPAAVSARVFLAAGLGALGWTFFSATTAVASDESAGLQALEVTLQLVETPAAELTDPAAAAVDAVVGHAASGLTEAVAPAAQPAPADLGAVQQIGTVVEDVAPVVEAPAAKVVQTVVPATEVVRTVMPTAESVVQELDAAVQHLDAAVQDAGLPVVLPEEPLATVTDVVVGQLDEAVDVVTAPIDAVTAPVEQVLEPVTDTLRPAVPILPESPAAPATDSEPAPAEPAPTEPAAEPLPTQAELASPVAETTPTVAAANPKEHFGSVGVEEAPVPSDGPEEFVATVEAVDLQAQPPGQGQSPSLEIMQLPAPVGAASISRATEIPSPTAGPISVSSFPITNGGSSGGGGGGSAGHGSADAYLAGGQYEWLVGALALLAESTALPASPVFDPGSTPD